MTTNHIDPDNIEEAFDREDERKRKRRAANGERHPSLHPKPMAESTRRAQQASIDKHRLNGHWV